MATIQPEAMTRAARCARLHGIYCIVNDGKHTLEIARAALAAGIGIVQYRAKTGIVPERTHALRELTKAHAALLIMNDDWEAALAYDCDGVHLGPDDANFANIAPIRDALGERIIGLSCGTVEDARNAETNGADYIGVGAVFTTASKSDAGEPIGIEGLCRIATVTTLPVCAIGGITAAHIPEVQNTSVAMAAVISALSEAENPEFAAQQLMYIWNAGMREYAARGGNAPDGNT